MYKAVLRFVIIPMTIIFLRTDYKLILTVMHKRCEARSHAISNNASYLHPASTLHSACLVMLLGFKATDTLESSI